METKDPYLQACPICEDPAILERHHVPPKTYCKKVGGTPEIMRICRGCHRLIHRMWGEGHHGKGHGWIGPISSAETMRALRRPEIHRHVQEAAWYLRMEGGVTLPRHLLGILPSRSRRQHDMQYRKGSR